MADSPFYITATTGGRTGTDTVSDATIGGGTIGNTGDGTASDEPADSIRVVGALTPTWRESRIQYPQEFGRNGVEKQREVFCVQR